MDCGCDDDDDYGLLGELNPDALQKGWMPRLTVNAGPDSCGGPCGRKGRPIDPNGDEDFPFVPPLGGSVTSCESETDPPNRDFLGVEGPAEGDENPCKSEEEACTQTLEDAGESATKWCDCVKPWVGDCVCMVFANEPGEDDDDEGEGPGDVAPEDDPEDGNEKLDGLWGISVALPALDNPGLGPILAGTTRGALRLASAAAVAVFAQPSFYCAVTCWAMPEPGCVDPFSFNGLGSSLDEACQNAKDAILKQMRASGCTFDHCSNDL
jgi:hypothetical protein